MKQLSLDLCNICAEKAADAYVLLPTSDASTVKCDLCGKKAYGRKYDAAAKGKKEEVRHEQG